MATYQKLPDGTFYLEPDGTHLTTQDALAKIRRLPVFTATVSFWCGPNQKRKVARIKAQPRKGGEPKDCWADIVTGQLYDYETGRCLSSTSMSIVGVPEKQEKRKCTVG